MSLESSMTKLGGGVNELEVHHLQSSLLGVGQQRLPQCQHPLLGSNTTSLDHEEVLLHLSVVREASHGVDGLIRQIVVSLGVVFHQTKIFWLNIFNNLDLKKICHFFNGRCQHVKTEHRRQKR